MADEAPYLGPAEAPDRLLVRILPFRREPDGVVVGDGLEEGEALLDAAFIEPVLSVWRGKR
jgi:hypothetical protein